MRSAREAGEKAEVQLRSRLWSGDGVRRKADEIAIRTVAKYEVHNMWEDGKDRDEHLSTVRKKTERVQVREFGERRGGTAPPQRRPGKDWVFVGQGGGGFTRGGGDGGGQGLHEPEVYP